MEALTNVTDTPATNPLTAPLSLRLPDLMGKVARWELVRGEPETMDILALRVMEGEPLRDICRAWGVPHGLVGKWIAESPERMQVYKGALAIWGDAEAQSTIGIADGASPEDMSVCKLQIDTRLKLAAKWNQEMYGDRVKVENSLGVGLIADEQVLNSMAALLANVARLRKGREIDVTPESRPKESDAD